MKILNVTNPKWSDLEGNQIDVTVEAEGLGLIPFTAHRNDTEAYSVEIFNKAVAGEYGEIAPYEEIAIPYDVLRRREYPSIGDQLDALMKWVASSESVDSESELKSLASNCMAIKDKYPKT